MCIDSNRSNSLKYIISGMMKLTVTEDIKSLTTDKRTFPPSNYLHNEVSNKDMINELHIQSNNSHQLPSQVDQCEKVLHEFLKWDMASKSCTCIEELEI